MKTNWSNMVKRLEYTWTRRGTPEYRISMINIIEEYLSKNPEWKILDAGCGVGLTFELLSDEYKHRYTGIDFTPEMIEHCKHKYPDYQDSFYNVDITDLSRVPNSDIIITQNVLQHILPYQLALMNLMHRTLKVLVCCERTHDEPTKIYGYDPIRWRFKDTDLLYLFNHVGDKLGFRNAVMVDKPKSTEGFDNVLTIYKVERFSVKKDALNKS
jgi:SAM-dependent methyltransferase